METIELKDLSAADREVLTGLIGDGSQTRDGLATARVYKSIGVYATARSGNFFKICERKAGLYRLMQLEIALSQHSSLGGGSSPAKKHIFIGSENNTTESGLVKVMNVFGDTARIKVYTQTDSNYLWISTHPSYASQLHVMMHTTIADANILDLTATTDPGDLTEISALN